MHPQAEQLASQFKSAFFSANRSIKWLEVEREHLLWLNDKTALVGRIDALGRTEDGEPFFAEWKTASQFSKRFIDRTKMEWRMNPQALTYGVLGDDIIPGMRKFTVRWVFKPAKEGDVVTTDFEWYTYTDAEIEWWRGELIRLADNIRLLRASGARNWPTNFNNCMRYGPKYACPFFEHGCSKLAFDHIPKEMGPRIPHLHIEQDTKGDLAYLVTDNMMSNKKRDEVVFIDASRAELFTDCHEKYRKLYEIGLQEESLALEIGTGFHSLVADHLKEMIK